MGLALKHWNQSEVELLGLISSATRSAETGTSSTLFPASLTSSTSPAFPIAPVFPSTSAAYGLGIPPPPSPTGGVVMLRLDIDMLLMNLFLLFPDFLLPPPPPRGSVIAITHQRKNLSRCSRHEFVKRRGVISAVQGRGWNSGSITE